jgi:molecular chaperone Hsp33
MPGRPAGHLLLPVGGADELKTLLDEDGEATLTCDFCLSQQHFDAVDLAELIRRL